MNAFCRQGHSAIGHARIPRPKVFKVGGCPGCTGHNRHPPATSRRNLLVRAPFKVGSRIPFHETASAGLGFLFGVGQFMVL